MSFPVPLWNQGQPRIATARAKLQQARKRYYALGVEIRSRARALRERLRLSRERARRYQKVQLPLRQKIVERTQRQYNAMQLGVFELLRARERQIRSTVNYIGALRAYWIARARIRQLLSGSTVPAGMDSGSPMQATVSMSAEEGGH